MYNVYIRPLVAEDSKVSYKWRNDPDVWTFTGSKPNKEITYEIENEWILKVLNDHTSKRFAIIVDDNYVGNIQLTNISSTCAEYHIFIGNKEYWGKGIAYLATFQILNYAKEELKLSNINLSVREDNIGAVKTYLKNGFEEIVNSDGWISMSVSLEKLPIPTVSVFCMVYNHGKFLKDTLEGFLMQKTNFNTIIVVGEDCSTDNSRKLLLEYVSKYPGKFKLLLHNKNIGAHANQDIILKNCHGKYIAMCEGDDYWIDENKLQKQVDILENNSDISICMTHVKYFYNGTDKLLDFNTLIDKNKTSVYTLKEYLRFRFSHTSSFVFRKIAYNNNLLQGFFGADQAMVINLALSGNIYYLNDLTSLYRISGSNITSATKKNIWINSTIEFYESVNKITNYKYSKLIRFHILYYKILKKIHIVFIELVWSKIYFISLKFFK